MTEIVLSTPKPQLSGEERRLAFKSAVIPHAQNAREARGILKLFEKLDQDYQAAVQLNQTASQDEQPIIVQWVKDIEQERETIGGEMARKIARERFRQEVNEIITFVNRFKTEKMVALGEVHPQAVSLVTKPQIPTAEIDKREPHSPPLLHHGLGILPTHRQARLESDILSALTISTSREWPQERQLRDVTVAVANLLPENLIHGRPDLHPSNFRRADEIAKGVVEITKLILDWRNGMATMPTAREVGLPSAEQDTHILRAVEIILANELYEELTKPTVNENAYRLRIQHNVSSVINSLAELIGHNGYEKVGAAIESLPDIEAAMLRSRLSISEDIKLGFPCSYLAHERRFVEMMNWAIFDHVNRGKDREGVQALAIDLILEKLFERVEAGDIDLPKVFGYLETLGYGEILITRVFDAATDEGRWFLIRCLRESGCFKDTTRNLLQELDSGYSPELALESLIDRIASDAI